MYLEDFITKMYKMYTKVFEKIWTQTYKKNAYQEDTYNFFLLFSFLSLEVRKEINSSCTLNLYFK